MDKQCPYCAETIKAAAIKCRYCHSDLSTQLPVAPVSSSVPPSLVPDRPPTDEVAMRFEVEKKSVGVAYFLWLIFGAFGGHRYYFGDKEAAIAMSGIAVFSLLVLYAGTYNSSLLLFGMLGYGIVAIWALVDAFQIPGWVKKFNAGLIAQLKANPSREPMPEALHEKPSPASTQPVSISICPKCRAQGDGDDVQCGRCGHAFATTPTTTA